MDPQRRAGAAPARRRATPLGADEPAIFRIQHETRSGKCVTCLPPDAAIESGGSGAGTIQEEAAEGDGQGGWGSKGNRRLRRRRWEGNRPRLGMPMKELMLWKPDALLLWKPDEGAVSVIVEIAELCNFNDCLYGICEDRAWYSPYSFDSIVKILELFDMFSY